MDIRYITSNNTWIKTVCYTCNANGFLFLSFDKESTGCHIVIIFSTIGQLLFLFLFKIHIFSCYNILTVKRYKNNKTDLLHTCIVYNFSDINKEFESRALWIADFYPIIPRFSFMNCSLLIIVVRKQSAPTVCPKSLVHF